MLLINRRALLQPRTSSRRTLAQAPLTGAIPAPDPTDPPEKVSPYANKVLPARLSATSATLTPYAGAWGAAQAVHLLRRCLFGPTRGEVQAAANSSLAATLDKLLAVPAAPAAPLNVSAADLTVPLGQTWVGQAFDQTLEGVRRTSLRDWWLGQQLGQQLGQDTSLSEKMTLFWHNHFVVEFGDINSAQYGYE